MPYWQHLLLQLTEKEGTPISDEAPAKAEYCLDLIPQL
jgi:hypothetical protein